MFDARCFDSCYVSCARLARDTETALGKKLILSFKIIFPTQPVMVGHVEPDFFAK